MTAFLDWLNETGAFLGHDYSSLWRWSVNDLAEFWTALSRYFEITSSGEGPALLAGASVEGARWFPEVRLNYVDRILRHPADRVAVVAWTEDGSPRQLTYGDLRAQAGAFANSLRERGVTTGDRVVAILPNSIEAVIALLAVSSIGAVWSTCAPEFGLQGICDRFVQIRPKVLIAAQAYQYRGRTFDLMDKVSALEERIESLLTTVIVQTEVGTALREPARGRPERVEWGQMLAGDRSLEPTGVPFDHPLWILYSSGTTGPPKPLVHGHGGIVLEHLKAVHLHCDVSSEDRFFWYTSTGWMMWNFLMGGLLVGSTIACYDGHPAWPDADSLWRAASDLGLTFFGTSAPYIENCRRNGLVPKEHFDLSAIRSVGSTGAPLSPEGFEWATSAIGDDVLVGSISGGTDVCTGFLGPCPLLPVYAGELQCRMLGAAVESYDESGHPITDRVGELVLTRPLPSMPIALYGDEGAARLHETYFAKYDGVWTHGDWVRITSRGGAVVLGRSDATLNRDGVRMGTAEFYRVVESMPDVTDCLVVDTSGASGRGQLVLVVAMAELEPDAGAAGPDGLVVRIKEAIRERVSPRHVPDVVLVVPALPHTLNGKRLEVPFKRILAGEEPGRVISRSAVDDPHALDRLVDLLRAQGLAGGDPVHDA